MKVEKKLSFEYESLYKIIIYNLLQLYYKSIEITYVIFFILIELSCVYGPLEQSPKTLMNIFKWNKTINLETL